MAAAYADDERFDYARRAERLSEALAMYRAADDREGQVRTLISLGNSASNVADHVGALDYLAEAQEIVATLADPPLQAKVNSQLSGAHLEMGDFATALHYSKLEWEAAAGSESGEARLMAANGLGCVLLAMGENEAGIAQLRESMLHIDGIEPPGRRVHYHSQSLADLALGLLQVGDFTEALACARQGAELAVTIDHPPLVAMNQVYASRAALGLANPTLAMELLAPAIETADRIGLKTLSIQANYERANALQQLGRDAEALAAYRAAHALEKNVGKDEAFRRAEFLRARKEISENRKEREAAERVLFTVLPQAIAMRIRNGEERIADEVADASVLFADLVGFTALSTRMPPRELLEMLERVFSMFDELTAASGLEKIKTIGDAYMVVGGALVVAGDHLERAARLAFDMLDAMDRLRAETGVDLAIRIGLHAGPAIAGVIGSHRLSYDLWGETVNLASRLESSGVPGRVHVSAEVARRLEGLFDAQPRSVLQLKGFGEVETFFLNVRDVRRRT